MQIKIEANLYFKIQLCNFFKLNIENNLIFVLDMVKNLMSILKNHPVCIKTFVTHFFSFSGLLH